MILKDEEIWENTYLIWKFLKDLYNKYCSISSVTITTYQESSVKSQEDKNKKLKKLKYKLKKLKCNLSFILSLGMPYY